MGMRVIGGEFRHRKLVYPESNKDIRPTKDRIREAFFSIVGNIENKLFLDLYAGSGSIGIEAISRGAKRTIFVDASKEALKYVKENISSLKVEDRCEIYNLLDLLALESFKEKGIQFDVIYLDPPYEKGKYEEVLSYIFLNNLISKNGLVAAEINRPLNINPIWNKKIKEYHYGEIRLYTLVGDN